MVKLARQERDKESMVEKGGWSLANETEEEGVGGGGYGGVIVRKLHPQL